MATITEVAQRANVSPATVSRYLAGERIRARAVVEAAISDLSYIPNAAARSLRSGRHGAIGVIVPDVTNPYFAAVVKGIESIARAQSYQVLLGNTDEDARDEHRLIDRLGSRVDGLIVAPATETDRAERRTRVPMVYIDREGPLTAEFDSVLADNRGGIKLAVDHLCALGHRRIALIAGPLTSTPGRERYESFFDSLVLAGRDVMKEYIRVADFRESGGRDAALGLIGMEIPPTAILVCNNLMTIGALKALDECSVPVPQAMSVIGFDDFALASLLATPLTVVARDEESQGRYAAQLLLARIKNPADPQDRQTIRIPTRLIERRSTSRAE